LKIEKKIIFNIFLIPLLGLISGVIGGYFLIDYSNKVSQQEGRKFLKNREIQLQKERLELIVDSVIHNIMVLKDRNQNYIEIIKKLYPPKKDKYIFIYKIHNLNGGKKFATMLLNINRPDLVGKEINDDYKDKKGFAFRKKMLELIRKQGYGFVSYYYKKPNSNKIIPKLSYFKYYPELKLVVASGVYLDDIQEIELQYKDEINKIHDLIFKKFILLSIIIFGIVIIFSAFIANSIKKEFEKFRKTIFLNEKKLRYKLYVDELTKLKSRKALVEDIEKNKFESFMLVDIDNFKNINQYFGSEIGDIYLKEFAKLLKEFRKQIKNFISIYRIGADEFGLGIKNSNYETTYEIAYKLNEFCNSRKIIINNEQFDVDVTIVFSAFPNPLKKSLITLTEAKHQHKTILSYLDIKDNSKEQEFFEMKKMLKEAIEKDQIVPFVQPIMSSRKKVIKYEMLMRIVTEERVIPPYFLEYAKKIKLYTKISEIMINKCFDFIEKTKVLCSINIDMQDILNEHIVKVLKDNLERVNKPVVFEILESESFQNYQELKKFMDEFKSYGVLFAIDDFGSGYSNYSEILELKPDYLKIDGSLIKNINNSKENLVLIESILFLTKIIGIKTTAEFVEDEKIFQKLKTLGINEFQGYYFSKPLPIDEIVDK